MRTKSATSENQNAKFNSLPTEVGPGFPLETSFKVTGKDVVNILERDGSPATDRRGNEILVEVLTTSFGEPLFPTGLLKPRWVVQENKLPARKQTIDLLPEEGKEFANLVLNAYHDAKTVGEALEAITTKCKDKNMVARTTTYTARNRDGLNYEAEVLYFVFV